MVLVRKTSWFQMQEDRGERDRPDPGQHSNVHRVHPRGSFPVPHTGTLYSVQHELINYIDAKGKCGHLKKLTCKGTLRQVFICLRPDPLLWPLTPAYTLPVYVYAVYLFTQGRGEGGRVESERRLEGQQFTKLGQKNQHDYKL
jgi:hypothetical protein